MTTDPRAALDRLVAAMEAHLQAASRRHGEADPAVEAAYETLADAYQTYDDAIYEAYDEVMPFVLYRNVKDELEDDEDDDDLDDDELDDDEDDEPDDDEDDDDDDDDEPDDDEDDEPDDDEDDEPDDEDDEPDDDESDDEPDAAPA